MRKSVLKGQTHPLALLVEGWDIGKFWLNSQKGPSVLISKLIENYLLYLEHINRSFAFSEISCYICDNYSSNK